VEAACRGSARQSVAPSKARRDREKAMALIL